MRLYEVCFYNDFGCLNRIVYQARTNKQAIKKAININTTREKCNYIQIWKLKKTNHYKIFGNENRYLYGINKGKQLNIE